LVISGVIFIKSEFDILSGAASINFSGDSGLFRGTICGFYFASCFVIDLKSSTSRVGVSTLVLFFLIGDLFETYWVKEILSKLPSLLISLF